MNKYVTNRWIKAHPHNVATHGSTEPVLTILDVRGFEIRDLFLIGFNDSCGSIIVETEGRANDVWAALEPAYKVTVKRLENGDWSADFDRRALDGSVPNRFITDLTLKDGTVVLRDGRWVR